MKVRLTDQALLAVAVARRTAEPRPASVAHLLLGLAAEPQGVAARALGRHDAALPVLAERAPAATPRLPSLETALGWAAREVIGRPLWTSDLLDAALEVGGADLADLLESCGVDADVLAREAGGGAVPAAWPAVHGDAGAAAETYGYDPSDPTWSAAAGRAVARTRALAGGAAALVVALAGEHDTAPGEVPLDRDEIAERLAASRDVLLAPAPPSDDDAGLDAVLDAARRISDPARPVMPVDLLRAAVLVGGRRAAALLAPSRSAP